MELRAGAKLPIRLEDYLAAFPHDLTPAMFACARVAGWSAHILEEKRTGRLIRPSAQYVGPGERPASAVDGAPVPS